MGRVPRWRVSIEPEPGCRTRPEQKEDIMAVYRGIENTKDYCGTVYCELTDMKNRLAGIVSSIEHMTGPEKEHLMTHLPHLTDIANTIDWKLGLIMKVCPGDFAIYGRDAESPVSVRLDEDRREMEAVPGGYVGG
jgi:hypothetical protein